MLRAVLRQFDILQPEVDFRRCLRSRDVSAGAGRCTVCAEVCPQAGVSFSAGVQLDRGSCTSCGLCAAACPTEAITDPGQQPAVLDLDRRARTISLGCRLGSSDSGCWSHPVQAVCGLSWRFLAAAALRCATRRVLLDCRNCGSCTHGPGSAAVNVAARRATTFLTAHGLSCSIEPITDSTSAGTPEAVSRRQFFRTVIGRAGSAAHQTACAHGLPRASQASLRSLLWHAALEPRRTPDSGAAAPAGTQACSPWGSFAVSSACSGCGDCAAVCPWQAWRIDTVADRRTVSFSMQRCRNCGCCLSRCPQRAISRTSEAVPHPQPGVQTLATVTVKRCRRCKKGSIELIDGMCHNCAKQASLTKVAVQSEIYGGR